MTVKDAIIAKIQPYTLPDSTIEVLALENGIADVNGEYQPNSFKAAVARTVVAALKQLITLTREQDHGSTQTYDPERLQERINAISRSLPEEEKEEDLQPQNEDISSFW